MAVMLVVAGCSNGQPINAGNGCEWVRPLAPTRADVRVISDGLYSGIVAHNETGAKICDWQKPAERRVDE